MLSWRWCILSNGFGIHSSKVYGVVFLMRVKSGTHSGIRRSIKQEVNIFDECKNLIEQKSDKIHPHSLVIILTETTFLIPQIKWKCKNFTLNFFQIILYLPTHTPSHIFLKKLLLVQLRTYWRLMLRSTFLLTLAVLCISADRRGPYITRVHNWYGSMKKVISLVSARRCIPIDWLGWWSFNLGGRPTKRHAILQVKDFFFASRLASFKSLIISETLLS